MGRGAKRPAPSDVPQKRVPESRQRLPPYGGPEPRASAARVRLIDGEHLTPLFSTRNTRSYPRDQHQVVPLW